MSTTAMDHVVAGLIVLSVLLLLLEIHSPQDRFYSILGRVVNVLFFVELSVRYYAAKSKKRFFTNYWVDVLSLLPLFLPELLALRALRLLRLFRLGPLMAQSNRRIGAIFRQTYREQLTILTIILITVVIVTLGLVVLEPEVRDVEGAFWSSLFSLVAGEPIGYHPTSTIGKLLTLVIMIGGLTVFALLTGTVSAVMGDRFRKGWSINRMSLEELEGHIVVCGWNRSARVLIAEFAATEDRREHAIVIIAEKRPELGVELDADPDVYFLEGDYTKVEVLEKANVRHAARAVLLADKMNPMRSDQDRDARTVLAGLTIEKLNPKIFTCAELLSRENEEHLRLAGIEEIVIGDEYSATILATSARVRGVTEIADEIFSNRYGNQIYKRPIRREWIGMSVLELQNKIKLVYDSLLIAVERAEEDKSSGEATPYSRTITNPPAHYAFQAGDHVILLAKKEPNW
jgi:voltage-gated potassium channel